MGTFYFAMYRNGLEGTDPYELSRSTRIFFTKSDGVLTFTKENPWNKLV